MSIKRLLQLHVLLDAQQRAGWEIEELEDGVRVRIQVGLPAPKAIEESVSERLERAMAGVSEVQERFSRIRAAEASLIDCLKGNGRSAEQPHESVPPSSGSPACIVLPDPKFYRFTLYVTAVVRNNPIWP
jgi:hypothetical protein